jgi:hypothetical protein
MSYSAAWNDPGTVVSLGGQRLFQNHALPVLVGGAAGFEPADPSPVSKVGIVQHGQTFARQTSQ